MATEKEIAALNALLVKVLEVNASSDRVNVEVSVDRFGVDFHISDPVAVLEAARVGSTWDWLSYGEGKACFSGAAFSEDGFIAACEKLAGIVQSFHGYAPKEEE